MTPPGATQGAAAGLEALAYPDIVARQDDDPSVTGPDRLHGLAVLWASADVVHALVFAPPVLATPQAVAWALYLAAALAVLLRPRSLARLGLLLASQIALTLWHLPAVPNHGLYLMLANGTLGVGLVVASWRAGGSPDRALLFDRLASGLRAGLVALYGVALWHKLNSDFLDPTLSCATEGLRLLPGAGESLPSWAPPLAIGTTLAVEGALALSLAWRKTRRAGIGLALAFHGLFFFVGTAGLMSFSVLIGAQLYLFLPRPAAQELARRMVPPRPAVIALALGLLAWIPVGYAGFTPGPATPLGRTGPFLHSPLLAALGLAWGIGVWTCLARSLGHRSWGSDSSRRPPIGAVALPLLVLLVGSNPYLGGPTAPVFSMFSNLRTDLDGWNHLWVPALTHGARLEEDRVVVVATDHRPWQPDMGRAWPWLELRRRLAETPDDLWLTYEAAAGPVTVVREQGVLRTDGRPLPPPGVLGFAGMRTVPVDGPNRCAW